MQLSLFVFPFVGTPGWLAAAKKMCDDVVRAHDEVLNTYTCLGSGIHRTAYKITLYGVNYAVKVARHSARPNQRDVIESQRRDSRVLPVLAHAGDYRWVLMPLAETFRSLENSGVMPSERGLSYACWHSASNDMPSHEDKHFGNMCVWNERTYFIEA